MNRVDAFKAIQAILKKSYTDKGMSQWWERKRVQLGGRTPSEAWADHDHDAVLELAVSGDAANSG